MRRMRMKKIMKKLFGLGRDERGEDLTETSSHLSTMGKVVVAGAVITGVGITAMNRTADAASAGDTVSKNVNGVVGAQSKTTDVGSSPFKR
jgi:hypothetical protein